MPSHNPSPIFIDALSFSQERKSGVGHIAEELSLEIGKVLQEAGSGQKVYLIVPLGKAKYVKKYINDTIKIKTVFLPARVLHLLNKLNILPPLDIFLGKGNYIFPNYRNWRLLFSKSFTYIHDLSYLHYGQFVEPKNLAYLKKNVPLWIRRADAIITSSSYTKKEIATYLRVEKDKIHVVPHGVNADVFYKRSRFEYEQVLASYGITKDEYILHVGNIEPRKNICGLIDAYSELDESIRKKHPLLLVGGGGWLNDAEQAAITDGIASGLDIVRPNKYVEDADLPALYSGASILAMPSFYEGFGLPPLQAMACGIPTVVADNSSLHELFADVAILVHPDKQGSVKRGLEEALGIDINERRKYNKKARMVVEKYSWRTAASKLLGVIAKVNP